MKHQCWGLAGTKIRYGGLMCFVFIVENHQEADYPQKYIISDGCRVSTSYSSMLADFFCFATLVNYSPCYRTVPYPT